MQVGKTGLLPKATISRGITAFLFYDGTREGHEGELMLRQYRVSVGDGDTFWVTRLHLPTIFSLLEQSKSHELLNLF
jgi:hypothetical protein